VALALHAQPVIAVDVAKCSRAREVFVVTDTEDELDAWIEKIGDVVSQSMARTYSQPTPVPRLLQETGMPAVTLREQRNGQATHRLTDQVLPDATL
jgi:hypothetical protein